MSRPKTLLKLIVMFDVLVILTVVLVFSTGCTVALFGRDIVGFRESDTPRNLNYSDPKRWDYQIPGSRDWDAAFKATNTTYYNNACHGPHYHENVLYKAGYIQGKYYHDRIGQ